MSVNVIFDGITYSIPESGDVGWQSLTDYLVAISFAASTKQMKYSNRIITTTPQTLQSTDTVVCVNIGSAASIVFPSGTSGQFYAVVDISGAAKANNITISATGGQLLNGESSYIINSNLGAVTFQYNGTNWVLVSEFSNVFKDSLYGKTEYSFVESSINFNGIIPTVVSGTSCSANFSGSKSIMFIIAVGGDSILCHTSYASDKISAISDQHNLFLDSDSGVGIFVSKSSDSGIITIKSRMGTDKQIEIKSLTNEVTAQTNWV